MRKAIGVEFPVSRAAVEESGGPLMRTIQGQLMPHIERACEGRAYRITEMRFVARESFERGPDEFDVHAQVSVELLQDSDTQASQ